MAVCLGFQIVGAGAAVIFDRRRITPIDRRARGCVNAATRDDIAALMLSAIATPL